MNKRWCSDRYEFDCWKGDGVRGAFIIDAQDGDGISWREDVNAGISGSAIRNMMLDAVEQSLGTCRTSCPAFRQRRVGIVHRDPANTLNDISGGSAAAAALLGLGRARDEVGRGFRIRVRSPPLPGQAA
jgi:hypothetical protein